MCFADTPETPAPAAPPEVLNQSAPAKKTAEKTQTNALSIGTKKYRNETGLGSFASIPPPSGIQV